MVVDQIYPGHRRRIRRILYTDHFCQVFGSQSMIKIHFAFFAFPSRSRRLSFELPRYLMYKTTLQALKWLSSWANENMKATQEIQIYCRLLHHDRTHAICGYRSRCTCDVVGQTIPEVEWHGQVGIGSYSNATLTSAQPHGEAFDQSDTAATSGEIRDPRLLMGRTSGAEKHKRDDGRYDWPVVI